VAYNLGDYMAFKLLKLFKGVPANYWRIISVSEDLNSKKTTVKVGLYLTSGTRKKNSKNALDCKVYSIMGIDLTRAQIYITLKALPDFKDAVDC